MKIVNAKYGLNIDIEENSVDVIIVENPTIMSDMISDLWSQINGGEGSFILSEEEIIKVEKNVDMVINPFFIDMNSRKIIHALYSKLAGVANDFVEEKQQINFEIINAIDRILIKGDYPGVEHNLDFQWEDLLKMYGVKISQEYDNLLLKLTECIKVMANLCGIRVLCLVNIKSYLKDDELKELYLQAHYSKMQLLLIENYEREKQPGEKIFIIDQDGCLIIK